MSPVGQNVCDPHHLWTCGRSYTIWFHTQDLFGHKTSHARAPAGGRTEARTHHARHNAAHRDRAGAAALPLHGHRRPRRLRLPGPPAGADAVDPLLLPQVRRLPLPDRRARRAPRGDRTPRLRGGDRPRHRQPRPPGPARGGLVPRRGRDRGERRRAVRLPHRRQGLERPLQEPGRLHPARPGAHRRPDRRPHRPPRAHVAQRHARPGGPDRRRGPPLPPPAARRRPLPAPHPRTGRRHPHRHPGGRRRRRPR